MDGLVPYLPLLSCAWAERLVAPGLVAGMVRIALRAEVSLARE